MRTTLDIDDSVLNAVKDIAKHEHKTAGEMVSLLLRQALQHRQQKPTTSKIKEPPAKYGFRPFPAGENPVSNAEVDKLRDDLGI